MEHSETAIIKTILYSDIFDFPLTKEELWQYLLSEKHIPRELFERSLKKLSKFIICEGGYYALTQRTGTITKRKKNLIEVEKKLRIAKYAAKYLSYIPTILFIGISGSLAIENVDKDADIDFFIITKRRSLFITRLWILALLEIMRLRRTRAEQHAANKICVNLLIEESELVWPLSKRDLYTAHEIIQVKPLFERNNTYMKFLKSNIWVEKFYPNAFSTKKIPLGKSWRRNYLILQAISDICRPFEILARVVQQKYMSRHKTKETVSDRILAFHPRNYRAQTLKHLRQKIQELGLLTNI